MNNWIFFCFFWYPFFPLFCFLMNQKSSYIFKIVDDGTRFYDPTCQKDQCWICWMLKCWKSLLSDFTCFNSSIKVSVDSLLLWGGLFKKFNKFFCPTSWRARNANNKYRSRFLNLQSSKTTSLTFCIRSLTNSFHLRMFWLRKIDFPSVKILMLQKLHKGLFILRYLDVQTQSFQKFWLDLFYQGLNQQFSTCGRVKW